MGRTLAEMVHAADDLELVGGLERAGSPFLGQSIEAGLSLPSAKSKIVDDIADLPAFEVLLDFTTTQSTLAHLATCLTRGAAMVIGTTGFTADEAVKIQQASTQITIVHAQNYSVGLTLLLDLVQQTSSKVGAETDVEILEWHHNQKVDAPSGTAYALLEAVKAGRQNAHGSSVHGREGLVGARPAGGAERDRDPPLARPLPHRPLRGLFHPRRGSLHSDGALLRRRALFPPFEGSTIQGSAGLFLCQ